MAIEFEFRGEWYRVDTPQEVVALKKYLRAHAQGEETPSSDSYAGLPAHGKWTSELFTLLMDKIGYFEKKFLAALVSVAHPMDATTVARLAYPGNYRYEKKKPAEERGTEWLAGHGGHPERARTPCKSPRAGAVRSVPSPHQLARWPAHQIFHVGSRFPLRG
jgi:hypothetical protein